MAKVVNYTVLVNGTPLAIVGRVKFKKGYPKVDVKTASIGSKVVIYENVNYEEAMGTVTITLPNTAKNQGYVTDWQENRGKNAISLTDESGEVVVFKKQYIAEDVEFDAETFEVTFVGGQGS